MFKEILTIGDKIDIRPLDKSGKPVYTLRTLASRLFDFVDTDVISIAAPIINSRAVILGVGVTYNLTFYTEKALYECDCIVISNHKENKTIVSVVKIEGELKKFQRRQYYRLECIHEIEYRIITIEEEILDKKFHMDEFKTKEERSESRKRLAKFENEWLQGAVIDLSGGGARFNSTIEHNKGDKIRIKLDLLINNNLRKMILGALIISSNKSFIKPGVYEHRVEFIDIMQRDREDLIKYIFEQERKRRKSDKS